MSTKELVDRILENANEFIDAWPDGCLSCIEQIRSDAETIKYWKLGND